MAMHVGVARVALHLAENSSLKGKRMVVKSVAQRVRNRFNVAVAEVVVVPPYEKFAKGFRRRAAPEIVGRMVVGVRRGELFQHGARRGFAGGLPLGERGVHLAQGDVERHHLGRVVQAQLLA